MHRRTDRQTDICTHISARLRPQIKSKQAEDVQQLTKVIAHQQRFCESIDSKLRESNVIIMGLPDGNKLFEGKMNDDEKVRLVLAKCGSSVITENTRLGTAADDK